MHLDDYMRKEDLTEHEVAKAIGRNQSTVNRIRRRLCRPDWDTIAVLKRWSKGAIQAGDFESLEAAE